MNQQGDLVLDEVAKPLFDLPLQMSADGRAVIKGRIYLNTLQGVVLEGDGDPAHQRYDQDEDASQLKLADL